jgi:hypothetical protein
VWWWEWHGYGTDGIAASILLQPSRCVHVLNREMHVEGGMRISREHVPAFADRALVAGSSCRTSTRLVKHVTCTVHLMKPTLHIVPKNLVILVFGLRRHTSP